MLAEWVKSAGKTPCGFVFVAGVLCGAGALARETGGIDPFLDSIVGRYSSELVSDKPSGGKERTIFTVSRLTVTTCPMRRRMYVGSSS